MWNDSVKREASFYKISLPSAKHMHDEQEGWKSHMYMYFEVKVKLFSEARPFVALTRIEKKYNFLGFNKKNLNNVSYKLNRNN